MFQLIRIGMVSLIAFLLASCVSVAPPSVPAVSYKKQSWSQRYQAQSAIQQWDVEGAFSIHQPNKTVIAAYSWQQKGDRYRIIARSSFDVYSVIIEGKPGRVSLRRSSQAPYTASSLQKLMREQLGWQLPVSNLRYWIRAIPARGVYKAGFDKYGHLVNLQQNGWTVYFSHYLPVGQVDLPGVLELSKSELGVKIIVKQWKTDPKEINF